ncbi:MAG: hypothetical protein E7812_16140 [Phenylobacterium sp.]|nr:MAG: hypothetical protein E7812_16140 [Phenylobacterium sp.]
MADERAGQPQPSGDAATQKMATGGGDKPDEVQPPTPAKDEAAPERYPSVRQDDAIEATESRSFDPRPAAGSDQPTNEGKVGPDGKPAGDDGH